jgi:methionyl-tRNA synthetase
LINLGPFSEDMDVTWEKLDQTYTSDLANGLGNLCSRVAKMCQKFGVEGLTSDREKKSNPELQAFIQKKDESGQQETWPTHFHQLISNYELSTSLNLIMNNQNHDLHHNNIQSVALLDKELSTSQPWLQEADQAKETLNNIVKHLVVLAEKLTPFMPETSSFIFNHFTQKEIVAIKPLFPRL